MPHRMPNNRIRNSRNGIRVKNNTIKQTTTLGINQSTMDSQESSIQKDFAVQMMIRSNKLTGHSSIVKGQVTMDAYPPQILLRGRQTTNETFFNANSSAD